jgi:hypothetical protein
MKKREAPTASSLKKSVNVQSRNKKFVNFISSIFHMRYSTSDEIIKIYVNFMSLGSTDEIV